MKMPKAIGMNEIVAGLTKDRTADELKLLIFNFDGQRYGLKAKDRHLVVPIVSNPKKAAFAIRWLVCEVERREKLQGAKKRPPDFEESGLRENGKPTVRDNRVIPLVVVMTGVERLSKQAKQDFAENYNSIARRMNAVGITAIGINEMLVLNVHESQSDFDSLLSKAEDGLPTLG